MNHKQEIIEGWLTKADHDLTTAHLVQNHLPDFKTQSLFIASRQLKSF